MFHTLDMLIALYRWKREQIMVIEWLHLNQRPQSCPSDSFQDVLFLSLFIVPCLKPHNASVFPVSSVHSLHISLWISLWVLLLCHRFPYPCTFFYACGCFQMLVLLCLFYWLTLLTVTVYLSSLLNASKHFFWRNTAVIAHSFSFLFNKTEGLLSISWFLVFESFIFILYYYFNI